MLCRRLIREEARRRIAEDGDLNRGEDLARVKGGGGNGDDKRAYGTVAVEEETARLSIFEGAKASKILAFTLG